METMPLFDVNGSVGKGAYRKPAFPTPGDMVAHMDYLGIERALVWHLEARDANPTWGNKKLLSALSGNNSLNKRLLPAFVITPACMFESGALEFLRENMRKLNMRALRIFPEVSRFPVRSYERILKQLLEFKPVIFCDSHRQSSSSSYHRFIEIEELALRYPQLTFVITQEMWGGLKHVMDLMWRVKNVLIDTSWIHTRENIELFVRQFGPDRVLFGTGYKSHNGAAIAALMHSGLGETTRRKIAHGNAEKLLGLDPAGFTAPGRTEGKPLWETFRKGGPVDVPVTDAHGHVGPTTRGWFIPENDYETQLQKMLLRMDELGIKKAISDAYWPSGGETEA